VCKKEELMFYDGKEDTDTNADILKSVSVLAGLYDFYIKLASSCLILLIIRAIELFTFSRNVMILLTVISRYKINLFFFIIMYMFLLFGFSFSGYIIFGANSNSFRDVGYSFINSFKIAVGGFIYDELWAADHIMAPIFFVIFALFFYVMLLNMLTAIVAISYEETMETVTSDERGEKPKSIIKTIECELQREFDEIAPTTERKGTLLSQTYLIISKMPLSYRLFNKLTKMNYNLDKIMPDKDKKVARGSNNEEKIGSSISFSDPKLPPLVSPMVPSFLKSINAVNNVEDMIENNKELNEVEKAQVALWMTTLESVLRHKSNNEMEIFDLIRKSYDREITIEFYPKQTVEELQQHVKDFVYSSRMSMKQKRAWREADLAGKYEYWCGMDIIHSEYYNKGRQDQKEEEKTLVKESSNEYDGGRTRIVEVKDGSKKEEENKEDDKLEENDSRQALVGEDKSDRLNESKENNEENNNEEDGDNNKREEKDKKEKKEKEDDEMVTKKVNVKGKKAEGDIEGKAKSLEESNDQVSESMVSVEVATGTPLVPREGDLTLKGMIISPEYASNYAKCVSPIQFDYWGTLTIKEKIELWLFYLKGKQRVKLWTCMKFSQEAVQDYVNTQIPSITEQNINLHDVWRYLNLKTGINNEEEVKHGEGNWSETDFTIMHKMAITKSK